MTPLGGENAGENANSFWSTAKSRFLMTSCMVGSLSGEPSRVVKSTMLPKKATKGMAQIKQENL